MVKVEKELGLAACVSCGVTSDEGSEITRMLNQYACVKNVKRNCYVRSQLQLFEENLQ